MMKYHGIGTLSQHVQLSTTLIDMTALVGFNITGDTVCLYDYLLSLEVNMLDTIHMKQGE